QTQVTNNVILFPRYKDNGTGGPGIQRIDPSNSGAQLLGTLVTDYFDQTIRRFILGEQVSGKGGIQIGSGDAANDYARFSRRIKYDPINLQETLTSDLVSVLYRYNAPGIPAGRLVFEVDTPNAESVFQQAQTIFQMGGAVNLETLYELA